MRNHRYKQNRRGKDNTQGSVTWILEAGKGKWRYVISLAVLQTFLGTSGVFFALFLKKRIDMASVSDQAGFLFYLSILVLLAVLQLLQRAMGRWQDEKTRAVLENRLKGRLFSSLLRKDYGSVTAVHTGEWMNRLTSDTVVIAGGITQIFPGFAGMLVKLVGACVMLLYLLPGLGTLVLPVGCVLILFTFGFRRGLKHLHRIVQEKDGALRIFLQEHLSGLLVVRSYAAESQAEEEYREAMEEHLKTRMKKNHLSNLCNTGVGAVMDGLYLLGVFWCGWGIIKGTATYGTLMAVLQLIGQIQAPFAGLSGYLPKYYAVIASAERLMEVEQFAEDMESKPVSQETIKKYYDGSFHAISIRNGTFTYRKKTGFCIQKCQSGDKKRRVCGCYWLVRQR